MKIYTKRGDKGQTDLFSSERVPKTNPLIEAYGTVDELNSVLGVIHSHLSEDFAELKAELLTIQDHLHGICARLANTKPKEGQPGIKESHIQGLEERCDNYTEHTPPLKHFILPGGHPAAATLHQARSVCRRAERRVIAASEEYNVDTNIITYLNRLSDLLFLQARFVNHKTETPEHKPEYK
ncbi:MAG: Cob(I)yrinic acid a,c-diamide adenosyltransferase [Candidatus Marinimicrobia bacterium]|nr:Cob(I)yrinic acid a,c-diamide adenosyltransferase [Candidatus Neomarinimicrobiota bacterium]